MARAPRGGEFVRYTFGTHDVKQKRADELRDAWGDAPCDHPQLAKLYDQGVPTGSFACVQCGHVFSFREKAELAASRRT
jgi:hypothetical protein